MIKLEQIQQRLITVMKDSKITQTEIARQLGIKPQTVQQYFSEKVLPNLETFANLCRILDISPAYILFFDDPQSN